MKILLSVVALTLLATSPLHAQNRAPQKLTARQLALRDAAREVELQKLKLTLYCRISFPTRIRKLEGDIRLAEAEVASFKRRVAEYRQFTKFRYSNPLFVSRENAKLQLLDAEIRLKNLKEELGLLLQYKTTSLKLRELELERARDRLKLILGERAAKAKTKTIPRHRTRRPYVVRKR